MLNLAKYFPREYVPPDLGPKMYNAFGQHASWKGMDPNTAKGGHTNLHCDVSDAVNVCVDVGTEGDSDDEDGDFNRELLMDAELGKDLRFIFHKSLPPNPPPNTPPYPSF